MPLLVPRPILNALALTQIMRLVEGKILGSIQVGMEDCPRIHKNSKHNKPSDGSEYSGGAVVGFLRKTIRQYERTRQNRLVDKLFSSRVIYQTLQQVGMADCARIHKHRKHKVMNILVEHWLGS